MSLKVVYTSSLYQLLVIFKLYMKLVIRFRIGYSSLFINQILTRFLGTALISWMLHNLKAIIIFSLIFKLLLSYDYFISRYVPKN